MSERKAHALAFAIALVIAALPASAKTTTTKSKPAPTSKATTWTAAQIQSLITKTLDAYLAVGKFIGPPGPQGPQGPKGASVSTYPANPSANSNGGSIAGFSQLSASNLTVDQTLTTKGLSVSGNATVTGGITAGSLAVTGSSTLGGTTTANNLTVTGTCIGCGGGGGTPAGSTGAVQFNNAGAFGADANNLFFDTSAKQLTIGGGGVSPPLGPSITVPDFGLLVLNTPSSPDYSEQVLASHSDGFAGNQYDWNFVAQNSDVNPSGGGSLPAGTLNYIGSIWMQMENTTNPNSVDWGTDIANGNPPVTNRPLMGNSAGDVGIGRTGSSFNSVPTPVNTASLWISGTTDEVGIGVTQSNVTARLHVAPSASEVGAKIQRASSQTADLLQFFDTNGSTVLSRFNSGGALDNAAGTFGSLPTCNSSNKWMQYGVSDSNANTWGATIAGGGSNSVLAFYDGTNWT